MKYRERLLRFIAGEQLTFGELRDLRSAGYISRDDTVSEPWGYATKNFKITELGLKKISKV